MTNLDMASMRKCVEPGCLKPGDTLVDGRVYCAEHAPSKQSGSDTEDHA